MRNVRDHLCEIQYVPSKVVRLLNTSVYGDYHRLVRVPGPGAWPAGRAEETVGLGTRTVDGRMRHADGVRGAFSLLGRQHQLQPLRQVG